jgi:hypothetical protein
MAECARRDCTNRNASEVRWLQPWPPPKGLEQMIGVVLCEDHADEIEGKLCQREGCRRYAGLVVPFDGHDHKTGAPRQDELQLCEPCWEALQAAPMPTINGITMVQRDGRMRALPLSIGEG